MASRQEEADTSVMKTTKPTRKLMRVPSWFDPMRVSVSPLIGLLGLKLAKLFAERKAQPFIRWAQAFYIILNEHQHHECVWNGRLIESFVDCFGYFYSHMEFVRTQDVVVVQAVVASIWQHMCEDLRGARPDEFEKLVKWIEQIRSVLPKAVYLNPDSRLEEAPLPETDRDFAFWFLAAVRIPGEEGEEGSDDEEEERLYAKASNLQIFDRDGNEITEDSSSFFLAEEQWHALADGPPPPVSSKNKLKNKKRLARRKKKKAQSSGLGTTSTKGKERAVETPEDSSEAESSVTVQPEPSDDALTADTGDVRELVNTLAEVFRSQSIHPGSAFAALSSLYSNDPRADIDDPDALRDACTSLAHDATLVAQMHGFLDLLAQDSAP